MTTSQLEDRAAFIRRICETPFDDAPRLIYADWLEENGEDIEARFIRNQFANCPCTVPLSVLMDLEPVLGCMAHQGYARQKDKEERPVCIASSDKAALFYERGFVNEIRLTCSDFMPYAKMLFERHPITRVTLMNKKPRQLTSEYPVFGWSEHSFFGLFVEGYRVPEEFVAPLLRTYSSEADALTALSRDCVDYGRELAGLPKLSWPQ